ncbi:UBX domain-containing protein 8 [Pteropus alecto]|uniref:UBX domain-containing protein 8 n=1 Tax=Pteropus alecto TaxID=9402 RepID=L5KB60_PTEAL|nr:UBX domain-containing protein 8 [Pteropus alecto]
MASRGVVGIFLLSALPLLCLELRRGIPDLEEEEKNEKRQKLVRKKQQEAQGEKVVTVALRCPSGSILRRRFFKSYSSQVLFDWMMKIGYHTSLYSLSTSFPRRPLEVEGGRSLQDIGITVDTILNVEEKEPSN